MTGRPPLLRIAALSAMALGLGVPAGLALGIYATNAIQPLPPASATTNEQAPGSLEEAAVEQQIGTADNMGTATCIGCGPGLVDQRYQAEQGDDSLYTDRMAQIGDPSAERYGDGLAEGYSVNQQQADETERPRAN